MIGTSLSGVTFVSVPGTVAASGMSYLMVVAGYLLGYLVIAFVLLPIYYRMQLTSIYDYLQHRFGMSTYKSGALLFIVSRTTGATARLYLVVRVLQELVMDQLGVPFAVTTVLILLLILAYTFKGGVKTIVWTDTLQTTFMLLGLVLCIAHVMDQLDLTASMALLKMQEMGYTRLLIKDPLSPGFYLKHLIGGAFIAITMTGLDQEMMQKNISVRTLSDSQKNVVALSVILLFVNFLFLFLGGVLYLFNDQHGLGLKGDDLFPILAMQYFPPFMGFIFIIALVSALFPSADGAITALTSSFCLDILGIRRNKQLSEERQTLIRRRVHLIFAAVFLLFVLVFHWLDNRSIIDLILKLAGYTYGPLLGLFAFGILTKSRVDERFVGFVCVLSPLFTWFLAEVATEKFPQLFNGFRFGFELVLVNGIFTFFMLAMISKRTDVASGILKQ